MQEKKKYKPEELIGYEILHPHKIFEAKNIGLNGIVEKVFAELQLSSDMKLYSYYKKNLGFIVEMPDTTIILQRKPDVVEGTTYLVKDVNYLNQLSYIFRDYFPLASNTFSIEFKVESVKNAFITYYRGLEKDNSIEFLSEKTKDIVVRIIPNTGFSSSNVTFGELNYNRLNDLMLLSNEIDRDEVIVHNTNQPYIGFDFLFSNPRLSRNINLYLSQIFLMHKIEHTFNKNASNSYGYKFNNLNTWTNIGFNYTFSLGKFSIAPHAGIFLNTYFGNTTSLTHYKKENDNTLMYTFSSKVYPDRISIGYAIGSYFSYKLFERNSIFVKLNYNYSKGVYDTFNLKLVSLGFEL